MSSVTLVSISTLTNMLAAQSLTCQVLQSNLLDYMLMTQTSEKLNSFVAMLESVLVVLKHG